MGSWGAYRRGVVVLVVVTLLWRGWTISRWSWDSDDWIYLADTESLGFWEYLWQDYNGHLMPAEFLVSWVVTKAAPLNFWLPVVLVALASAGNVWLWGRALAALAGERLVLLAPLGLLALTPLMIRPTIWWASSLQALPLQITLAVMVTAAARLARGGGRRDLVWLLLALVGGLLFWQKALLLVIPTVAVLLHLSAGSLTARVRRHAVSIAALAGVCLAYLGLYAALTGTAEGEREMGLTLGADRSPSTAAEFFGRAVGDLFAPALLGGPWGSTPLSYDPTRPPALVVGGCALVVAGLVVWALVRVVGAWLPLTMTLAYAALSWGLVLYSGRFDALGMVSINDERYHVDSFAVAMLAVALLLVSPRRAEQPATDPATPARHRSRWTAGAVAAGLAVSLVVANVWAASRIGTHPGREWVANVTDDVERREPVTLVDDLAPDTVFPPVWWGEDARLSRILAPLRADVSFGVAAERLWQVGEDGRLVPVAVGETSRSEPGDAEGCGHRVDPGTEVRAGMTTELFSWGWLVQVDTMSGDGGTLVVDLDGPGEGRSVELEIPPGLAQRQFAHTGAVPSEVTLSAPPGSGAICVAQVVVGEPVPAPDAG